MQHTTNYNLNQWEDADRVTRADVNADNAKLDAALTGLDAAIAGIEPSPLVKLLDYTTTEEAASFSVDVSALALGDYPLLFMLLDSPAGGNLSTLQLTVNGDTTKGHYYTQGSSGSMVESSYLGIGYCCGLYVLRKRDGDYLRCRSFFFDSSGAVSHTPKNGCYTEKSDPLQTFDFISDASVWPFPAGARVTIWALRR